MKEFHNILEAINYHKECYRCKSQMIPLFHSDTVKYECEYNYYGALTRFLTMNLSSQCDSDTDDFLTINCNDNTISLRSQQRGDSNFTYTLGSCGPVFSNRKIVRSYVGDIYESLKVKCSKCYDFYYVIQMIINMDKLQIKHLLLNSEHIIWSDNSGDNHEIKNIYATGKTECLSIIKGKKHQQINIPIISLNLSDPNETMARIKKLNLFS